MNERYSSPSPIPSERGTGGEVNKLLYHFLEEKTTCLRPPQADFGRQACLPAVYLEGRSNHQAQRPGADQIEIVEIGAKEVKAQAPVIEVILKTQRGL